MSNLDRRMAWIFSACFPGFSIWKHSCFFVSDMKVMRLVSLCWQLWPRHAVPHAPLSHVPAAWWAGGGRRDGEGAHSSHPRGSLLPCCRILQSPVHSHSHPLTPGGDAADAPGRTWQPWTQVHVHDIKKVYKDTHSKKTVVMNYIYSLMHHSETRNSQCFPCFSPLTSNSVFCTVLLAIFQNHIVAFRLISYLPGSHLFQFISVQHKNQLAVIWKFEICNTSQSKFSPFCILSKWYCVVIHLWAGTAIIVGIYVLLLRQHSRKLSNLEFKVLLCTSENHQN